MPVVRYAKVSGERRSYARGWRMEDLRRFFALLWRVG